MKKFIFTIPRQNPQNLTSDIYKSADSKKLENNISTCFPILPVISSYCDNNEEIQIIALVATEKDNEKVHYCNCESNLKKFEDELESICCTKQIKSKISIINVAFNETLETHLNTYYEIIEAIDDGDTIFADITYGSKPLPIVEMIAISFCTKNKDNVMLECMCYGEMDHETKEKRLFDVTSLFYLDEISSLLSQSKISNPQKLIKGLIK